MKRRQLLLAAAVFAAVPGLHAQAPRLRRVAIGSPGAPPAPDSKIALNAVIRSRLAELGWIEARNIEYLHGYAHGDAKRYEPMIAELLAQKPDALVVMYTAMALVAKKLTQDVPIVFTISSNPEKVGLVASLARPGGNVTGVSTREAELLGKRIQLLSEIRPGLRRIAVLVNHNIPDISQFYIEGYAEHARKLGMELLTIDARSEEELRLAYDRMSRDGVQGVLGTADSFHFSKRSQLIGNAARLRLPAIYTVEQYVEAGGLASFGLDIVDQYRRAAGYVDKILRGAKSADLPVQEPTNFHLAINLKAARALGIKLPQSVLVRADLVIE